MRKMLGVLVLLCSTSLLGAEEHNITIKRKFITPFARIGVKGSFASIGNIPEDMRRVSEYNRETKFHTLSSHGSGFVFGGTIGGGATILRKVELAIDWSFFINSYQAGRDTWSEIGFPSQDYLGYAYKGRTTDFSMTLPFVRDAFEGRTIGECYVRGGARKEGFRFASGADAWNTFLPQHEIKQNHWAYLAGVGCRVGQIMDLELETSVPQGGSPHALQIGFVLRWNIPGVGR